MRQLFAAVAAVVLAAGYAGAAPVPAKITPLVTVQTQSLETLDKSVAHFVDVIGGKQFSDRYQEFMKKDWAVVLAVSGIDPKKPFLGYADLNEDFAKSYGLFLLPVANENLFLQFMATMPKGNPFKFEKLKASDALYEVTQENGDPPVRVLLRYANGYAYFGINVRPNDMDEAKLLAPAVLTQPKETALATVRLNPEAIPAATRKNLLEKLDQVIEGLFAQIRANPAAGVNDLNAKVMEGYASLVKKLAAQALNETDVAVLEFVADTKTNEFGLEIKVTPKKGSAAAKEIAARKPELSQLAGFMPKEVAAAYNQSSLGQKEIRDSATAMYETYKKKLADDPPPEAIRPLAEEALDLLKRSQEAGKGDYSIAAYGPNKSNQFNYAGVITCDDPSKLEKILRDLHANDAPEEIKKEIKFDVAKIGKVAIHQVQVENLPNLPPQFPKGTASIAFAPNAIYITHGPDSLAMLKELIVAKPAPVRPLETTLNPARFVKLLATFDERIGTQAEEILGKDDKLLSALHFDVIGGETLRIRIGMHALVLPKLIMYFGTVRKDAGN